MWDRNLEIIIQAKDKASKTIRSIQWEIKWLWKYSKDLWANLKNSLLFSSSKKLSVIKPYTKSPFIKFNCRNRRKH